MKTYATASNARRAAKKAIDMDRPEEHIDFTIEGTKETGFTWHRVQVETKAPTAPKAEPVAPPTATDQGEEQAEADWEGEVSNEIGVLPNGKREYRKGAVREVWDICDENKDLRRKDVIAICVSKGINYYTARTQYQAWRTAMKNSGQ